MGADSQLEISWASTAGVETTSPAPAQAHSRTSAEAAAKLPRWRLAGRRLEVLLWISGRGELGATDEEGQAATGLDGNSWRPRRGELSRCGLLDKRGERMVASGNAAEVWVITALGLAKLKAAKVEGAKVMCAD